MINDHRNPWRDYLFLYPRCCICSFLAVRFRLCIVLSLCILFGASISLGHARDYNWRPDPDETWMRDLGAILTDDMKNDLELYCPQHHGALAQLPKPLQKYMASRDYCLAWRL